MAPERKALLDLYKEHRVETEKKLFEVIKAFSDRENMTATDAGALAAVAEALVSVQKMGCY